MKIKGKSPRFLLDTIKFLPILIVAVCICLSVDYAHTVYTEPKITVGHQTFSDQID